MSVTYYKRESTIIFSVHEDDLYDNDFALAILNQAERESAQNVILEVGSISVIHSQHIKLLDDTVSMLSIIGKKAFVCGFQPVTLSGIVHFLETFQFRAYLSVDEALNAIHY